MHTTADLREITDRVLGLSLPRVPAPARAPRRLDKPAGLALLLLSASASTASITLWAAGHGGWALRLIGAAILMLTGALRLL